MLPHLLARGLRKPARGSVPASGERAPKQTVERFADTASRFRLDVEAEDLIRADEFTGSTARVGSC